ncbi:MAG TPA: diguanylate cyclase [Anaerolineaceae bacterium]|nr:diguanylate cyclase [Anaerolineaceae bacterium]
MGKPLYALIVAKTLNETESIAEKLRESGFDVRSVSVLSEKEFLANLYPAPDVIIATYLQDDFSAVQALQLLQALEQEVPFIVISDPIGEEQAVALIKQGVDDFLLTENIDRLGLAVVSAVQKRKAAQAQRHADETLLESANRFQGCIDQLLDGVGMFSAVRDADMRLCNFRVDYLNQEAKRPTFFLGELTLGSLVREGAPEFEADEVLTEWRRVVNTGEPLIRELVRTNRTGLTKIEQVYELRVTRLGDGVVATWRDITWEKKAAEELRVLSTRDPLTGLLNRSFFEAELERLDRSRLHPISVILADIDGLKTANEHLGTAGGDELLCRAARMLNTCFRSEDAVSRIGEDEFAVLLPKTDDQAVQHILERVRSAIWEDGDGQQWPLSLSLGAATAYEREQLTPALKSAIEQMMKEKHARRNGQTSLSE